MENFEKMEIGFDESRYNLRMKTLEAARKTTQNFFDALAEVLQIEVTDELVDAFLHQKREPFEQAIRSKIHRELDGAKITSRGIRENAIKDDVNSFREIWSAAQHPRDCFRAFAVQDGRVCFRAGLADDEKEKFTYSISTPEGAQLYQLHQKLAEAINEFYSHANPQILKLQHLKNLVKRDESGKIILFNRPGGGFLDYDRLADLNWKPNF